MASAADRSICAWNRELRCRRATGENGKGPWKVETGRPEIFVDCSCNSRLSFNRSSVRLIFHETEVLFNAFRMQRISYVLPMDQPYLPIHGWSATRTRAFSAYLYNSIVIFTILETVSWTSFGNVRVCPMAIIKKKSHSKNQAYKKMIFRDLKSPYWTRGPKKLADAAQNKKA